MSTDKKAERKKDWLAKLRDSKDLPKVVKVKGKMKGWMGAPKTGGVSAQKKLLRAEGHRTEQKGKKVVVQNLEKVLYIY